MQSKVQIPALALMVSAAIAFLWSGLMLAFNLLGLGLMTALKDIPNATELFSGTWSMLSAGFGLLVEAFIIFGCLKMKNLESYGLALGAAIVAVVPCINPCPCCIFNFGLGLWALIVLLQADVKAAFAGAAA